MGETLTALVGERFAAGLSLPEQDADLERLVAALTARFGDRLQAVILYGSYTRGARDSLVDLYALLDRYRGTELAAWHGPACALLAPNVYHLALDDGLRCKYAMLPLDQFTRALQRDFHSYFWARFAQPSSLLYVAAPHIASRLIDGLAAATGRMLDEGVRGAREALTPTALWQRALAATYRCELRAERGNRATELAQSSADHLGALALAHAQAAGWDVTDGKLSGWDASGGWRWPLRRAWGKLLSVLRLIKAAATFNDGFEYLLWKIERHSGIYVEPNRWQRRAPLLFAWPLFWRLYRLGAFR
ncbi:MAG: hypothetical protein AAF515_05305 [Pseudomonadota bacterium]